MISKSSNYKRMISKSEDPEKIKEVLKLVREKLEDKKEIRRSKQELNETW